MGIENKLTPTVAQAKIMSDFAGIELAPDQIEKYVSLRQSIDNIKNSDQKILYTCLEPAQKETFEERFKNIKF